MEKTLRMTLPVKSQILKRKAEDGTEVEDMIVEGYAFKFNKETLLYESRSGMKFYEVIERGAADSADMTDVPMKYNHDDSVFIVARTRNKSLQLNVDDVGLKFQARFIDTQTGRDLFKMIQEGLIDKMSFAFTTDSDGVIEEYADTYVRSRITKFKRIWDISAVDIPAYDDTEIYARSFADLEKRAEQALDSAKRVKYRRQRLSLQTKIFLEEQTL